jgi:hypothetical protein
LPIQERYLNFNFILAQSRASLAGAPETAKRFGARQTLRSGDPETAVTTPIAGGKLRACFLCARD